MTLDQLYAKVRDWDFLKENDEQEAKSKYTSFLQQLCYHGSKEWKTYLPAQHPDFNPIYMERLAAWIGNLTDKADQKLLLEYALYISFFSHDDFVALYRTALDREISRWVASQVSARLEPGGGQSFHDLVYREIHRHTWFCPVTDSMDINEFYKVNHLKGIRHRPGFATLQMLAETAGNPNASLAGNVRYCMDHGNCDQLSRLVLLEDIVGSGSQCLETVRWAVAHLGAPVLFVPLILCPNGVDALRAEEQQSGGLLTVRPVIELQRTDLLGPERQGQTGWPIAQKMEDLANRCASRASGQMDIFGYKNTGCSLATFSNTPDNTIPIVHHKPQNGAWEPLFPRIYRD